MMRVSIALTLLVRTMCQIVYELHPGFAPFYQAAAGSDASACGSDVVSTPERCTAAFTAGGFSVDNGVVSDAMGPTGCMTMLSIVGYADAMVKWNEHPTGGTMGHYAPVCESHTPAPTPASMSGDPIISMNGYKIKFDLPYKQASLLWGDETLQVHGKADISTPDMSSQWFSEIILASKGRQFCSIYPRKVLPTSKAALDSLNTLSVIISEHQGDDQVVTHPRSYSIGNDDIHVAVRKDNRTLGRLQREVVSVKSKWFDFSIAPEAARKFPDAEKALKYIHLDITMQKMMMGATGGILAELFGFVPLTAKTARLIRSMHRATE